MEIRAALSQISDFRREQGKKHALVDILRANTILRVLAHIDSKQFERIFMEWTKKDNQLLCPSL